MKRSRIIIGILFLMLTLSACGNSEKETTTKPDKKDAQLEVYTTVYPLQYFAEQIGGETVSVQSIYPAGTDEHSFDPTQKEMMHLSDADLFFYVGLGLEGFVENAKKTLSHEHVKLLSTADQIDKTKLMEGHSHESEEDGHDHAERQLDPHVWISPLLSIDLASAVRDGLVEQAPENKDLYDKNFETLQENLKKLDAEFTAMSEQAQSKTFFVSHAAFGYVAKEYQLEQVSIAGLNTQNEPSQKELAKIVSEAKEANVKTILFEQNVSSKLTKVVQNEIGADSAVLHNLAVLTKEDIANGEDYFSLMKRNIEVLSTALK